MWSVFMIVIHLQSSKVTPPPLESQVTTKLWLGGLGPVCFLVMLIHPSISTLELVFQQSLLTFVRTSSTPPHHLLDPTPPLRLAQPDRTKLSQSILCQTSSTLSPLHRYQTSSSSNILFAPLDPTEPHRIASIILTLTLVEFRPGHRSGHLTRAASNFPGRITAIFPRHHSYRIRHHLYRRYPHPRDTRYRNTPCQTLQPPNLTSSARPTCSLARWRS